MRGPAPVECGAALVPAAAVAAVVAHPPAAAPTAAWSVGLLVLGAATLVAAGVVRRGGGAVPAAWSAAVGVGLLASAVTATTPSGPAVGLDDRVTALVLVVLLPGLVLSIPAGGLVGIAERVAGAAAGAAGLAVVVAPVPVVAVPGATIVVTAVATAAGLRFERSRDVDRERMLWLVLGGGTAAVVGGHLVFASEAAGDGPAWIGILTAAVLSGLLLPAAVVVAVLAPRVADVRRLTGATVVAVIMVDLTLGCFMGTLALLEAISGHPPSRLATSLLCVVVAAGFRPASVRVREALDQVLFGGRPDPVGVVTTLGAELRRGGGPQEWLDALRAAVGIPYAELRAEGDRVAASGACGGPTASLPLQAGDEHVGDLLVGLPEHHRELPRDTEKVLRLAAAPLARALQSARLAEELQRSRQRVVVASEEERRRVRRDLHDGLGPVLSGVAYTADAARNVLASRPEQAADLLADLRGDVAGAIAEVRRIVHDLRPPVLDQLGLVPALRQQAARMRSADDTPVAVSVTADDLPALPAAVEVAAYRMITEAVLNAVRHGGARSVDVVVGLGDGALHLTVSDDGVAGTTWSPGVGLTSMRERVEQLGGTLSARPTAAGGLVEATVTIESERPAEADVTPGPPAAAPAARPT